MHINHEDINKMNFKTRHGHYEYTAFPSGLKNIPTTFMCLMNGMFKDLLEKFSIVFLDDILVYSKSGNHSTDIERK